MSARLFVLGTFDQTETALYEVDLMRCLHEAGVTPVGVIYKRSRSAENPDRPVENGPGPDGRHFIHVHDFNATDLVRRLEQLDYPRDLLDIILIVEEDDRMTRDALTGNGSVPSNNLPVYLFYRSYTCYGSDQLWLAFFLFPH